MYNVWKQRVRKVPEHTDELIFWCADNDAIIVRSQARRLNVLSEFNIELRANDVDAMIAKKPSEKTFSRQFEVKQSDGIIYIQNGSVREMDLMLVSGKPLPTNIVEYKGKSVRCETLEVVIADELLMIGGCGRLGVKDTKALIELGKIFGRPTTSTFIDNPDIESLEQKVKLRKGCQYAGSTAFKLMTGEPIDEIVWVCYYGLPKLITDLMHIFDKYEYVDNHQWFSVPPYVLFERKDGLKLRVYDGMGLAMHGEGDVSSFYYWGLDFTYTRELCRIMAFYPHLISDDFLTRPMLYHFASAKAKPKEESMPIETYLKSFVGIHPKKT